MIEVKNLTKKFGRIVAVNNVSFSVGKGEVVGVLGPNGAGKTTILRILAGFLSSDSGMVKINGTDVEKNLVEVQKQIGYLPENNPLYKNMQVAEFLELASELHRISKSKKKEALDFVVKAVDVEKVYYVPISELSKGYKQRVGIAAALIHRPQIIILDEPTEGLDPNQRTEIRQLIKNLSIEHTIIMSTHVMQEALAVCSRMLIINKGRIIADGTPDQLSRLSKKENILELELEGSRIEEELKPLSDIKKIEVKKIGENKFKIEVISGENVQIEPVVSQKIWENKWVVWRLEKQKSSLEEIFRELTKE